MKNGEYLLSTERVSKAFRKQAIPALITTLISQIYNLTDAYFIGLLNDTAMLSAVSMAMPVMWLVSALCNMIAAGAPQLISLRDGAADHESSARCCSFAIYGTLIMSLIITPVAYMLIKPALRLMTSDSAVTVHASEYLRIIILSSPITAVAGALRGILSAKGYSRRSSTAGIAGIAANIVLDPIFILGFDMGMAGAAWATALGSIISLIVSIVYVRNVIDMKPVMPKAADMGFIFKLSLASTITSVITSLTVGISFTMAADYSTTLVASISVCSRIYATVISIVSALAFSIQPFIGYNYASGDHKRLIKGLLTSLAVGQTVCIAGLIAFLFGGELFMRCFTSDPALIADGAKMLRLMSISLPVCALQFSGMSYMSGTGKAMRTLGVSLARQILIFVPVMLVLRRFLGETGLMLAYPITDIIATIPAVALCTGEIKKMFAESRNTAKPVNA